VDNDNIISYCVDNQIQAELGREVTKVPLFENKITKPHCMELNESIYCMSVSHINC
jgi:hypothetical protein